MITEQWTLLTSTMWEVFGTINEGQTETGIIATNVFKSFKRCEIIN